MLRTSLERVTWVGLALAAFTLSAAPADDYVRTVETARAERLQGLTSAEGWLTLVGLHFLRSGENSVGSASGNQIVLSKGPAHLGTLTLGADGRVAITLNPAADALVGGRQVLTARLDVPGDVAPPRITCGSLTLVVIDRGGRKALRVKDSAAERRSHFAGLDYFPIDPSWRVEADWVAFDRPRQVAIRNILGQESSALIPGKAVFARDGKNFELLPLVEGDDEPLLFVFADLTSGQETYAAARFIYADPPQHGKLVLDFNQAVNPPCAFTPFATCPLPPRENRLPIAVRAGEKRYRGSAE